MQEKQLFAYTDADKFNRAVEKAGGGATVEAIKKWYIKLGGRIEGDISTYQGVRVHAIDTGVVEETVREKSGKEVESLPKPPQRGRPPLK